MEVQPVSMNVLLGDRRAIIRMIGPTLATEENGTAVRCIDMREDLNHLVMSVTISADDLIDVLAELIDKPADACDSEEYKEQ